MQTFWMAFLSILGFFGTMIARIIYSFEPRQQNTPTPMPEPTQPEPRRRIKPVPGLRKQVRSNVVQI